MQALAQFCVRRPVFATMLILSLVVVGVFSYFSLGVDLFPKVDIPTVQVLVEDRGASPEEIETEVSKKIEDAVNTISQIDEVRSTSSEGQSLVIVTFELSKNGDVAAQEVQNKVNLIANDLPQTAKTPIVQKFDPDAAPILQVAVSAPRSLRDVTLIGRSTPGDSHSREPGPLTRIQPDRERRIQRTKATESRTARRKPKRGRP
jgi:HAE1 family hydrophobic/amphiphilic exporter-1